MITSTNNARVKKIAEYCKKAKARREDGVFVVEGIRMVREVPIDLLRELYVTPEFMKNISDDDRYIIEEIGSSDSAVIEEVSEDVMEKMADTKTPQGVLAVVRQAQWELSDMLKDKPMLLILENIQDPGNLGTMFRTGEGAGVTGIIMSSDMADVYNPKVVRSTMGAIFRMPFIYVDSIPETVKALEKEHGVITYAAHLKGTKNYDEIDYHGPCAFMIGNEGNGLTKEAADAASEYVLIPMLGKVESMNAAVSAAVLTFEAARQRRN
ncbi:TrmH family RNA methyltransferase [Butyrivibrio sp. MB2005]|uniref:TrmH family RNA methyltransferase n=1 Tax=Butyrivibrio sp. MB2005 TaxID=1280678 RepID=UPI000426D93E|nr:RNA methyltransferase [Butyrivibrio sp. MB2005]